MICAGLLICAAVTALSCQPDEQFMALMEMENFSLLGAGVTSDNRGIIRFYVSVKGEWMATMTYPNGLTCKQGRGYGWTGEICFTQEANEECHG